MRSGYFHRKKKYKTQFSTNQILKDKIKKNKKEIKKQPKSTQANPLNL
jgi:hypothetical protein